MRGEERAISREVLRVRRGFRERPEEKENEGDEPVPEVQVSETSLVEDRRREDRMNHLRLLTLLSFLPSFEFEFEMAVPPEVAHSWYILSPLSLSFSVFFSSLSFELELLNNDPSPNPDDFFDLVL